MAFPVTKDQIAHELCRLITSCPPDEATIIVNEYISIHTGNNILHTLLSTKDDIIWLICILNKQIPLYHIDVEVTRPMDLTGILGVDVFACSGSTMDYTLWHTATNIHVPIIILCEISDEEAIYLKFINEDGYYNVDIVDNGITIDARFASRNFFIDVDKENCDETPTVINDHLGLVKFLP